MSQLVRRMEKLESCEFGCAEVKTAKQGTLTQASSSRVNNEPKPIICFMCGQEGHHQTAPDAACMETGDPRCERPSTKGYTAMANLPQ